MHTLKLTYWRYYWLLKAGITTRPMYASAALLGGVAGLLAAFV